MQKQPLAYLVCPWLPLRNGVQTIRFGEVPPVLRDPAEQRPQGQATLRGSGAMITAHFEHCAKVPRSEAEIEGRAAEQRRPPIVEQRFHLRLDGAEHDQAAGSVPILKAIHLRLQQRGQTAQRPAMANLKLVEDHDDSRRTQRAHGGRHPGQAPSSCVCDRPSPLCILGHPNQEGRS